MRQIRSGQPFDLWRSRGLRWGVTVAVMLGSSLVAMFGLMYWRSSVLLFETLDRSVIEQLELLSVRPPDMLPFMISSRMKHQPAVLTQVGLFTFDGNAIVGDVTEIPSGIVMDGRIHWVSAPGNVSVHWNAAGRKLADGRILIVARASDEILEVRRDLVRGAVVGIVPAILLSLGGGAVVGMATERRLRTLNAISERIVMGDLSERLPARADGDELDRLCTMVNRILERLDEGVDALKGVGENIAHDLRTPLTLTRVRLERSCELAGADTPLGQSIEQAILGVDQALSIVTALLRIADIQHVRRTSAFTIFDLAGVMEGTAESYQPVADEKGVALTCVITAPASIWGDRQLMTEALVNIVDNAVKFTPKDGQVRLELNCLGGQPVMSVSDTGPGILVEARSAVFRRFYRAEPSRTTKGIGLGLSLVAAVAKLHGFTIKLSDNTPGCRIEIYCRACEK